MINVAYLTLDDRDGQPVQFHRTDRRRVRRASGLVGLPPVRSSVRPRPTRHGTIDRSRWVEGSLVVLEGFVTAAEPGGHDALNELRQLSAPLIDTLEHGPALLRWREGTTGQELQRAVKFAGGLDGQLDATVPTIPYQVQLRSEDYRAFSQTLQSATSAPLSDGGGGWVFPDPWPVVFTGGGGGGVVAWQNDGNVATPPVLKLYGGLTDPRVLLEPGGQEIVLVGEVGSDDYIEIDVAARTVTLNGDPAISRMHFVDFSATTWFELPSGQGTCRLLAAASSGAARLSVEYRAAFA